MKAITRIKVYSLFVLGLFLIIGCKKEVSESNVAVQDRTLEFDVSSSTQNAPGKDYPLMPEVVPGSGQQAYRIVLRGPSYPVKQNFNVRVVESETTALENVHYSIASGDYVIPGRQKQGSFAIEILPFPDESDSHAILVLELVDADGIAVVPGKSKVAIPIYLKEKEPEPLPTPDVSLWEVLDGGTAVNGITYRTIYIDQFNPKLPAELRQAFVDANDGFYADYLAGDHSARQFYGLILQFRSNVSLGSGKVDVSVPWIAAYTDASGTIYNNMSLNTVTTQYRYDFMPNSQGVGKFENPVNLRNGGPRSTHLKPIFDYLEQHEFKLDWVGGDIANPTRPNEYLGGLYGQGDIAGDVVFGSLTTLASSTALPYALSLNPLAMQSSPKLHTSFFDGDNSRYFNALTIDPNASYQSEGFKNTWAAAQTELGSTKSLHKMMLYFGVTRFNFHTVLLSTYYTDGGTQRKGLINFDFKIDYSGNVKPWRFMTYPLYNGLGTHGEASRTDALVDNMLMAKEFVLSKNGSRVRFTDKSNSSFYFEGELGYYTMAQFNALNWIP